MTPQQAYKLGFVTYLGTHGITPSELMSKVAISPAIGAAALSLGIPYAAGTVSGSVLGAGLSADEETPVDLRKKYLIKKYRDLIRQRRARMQNALLSAVKAGVK